MLGIERARLLYEATKNLQFSDIPSIDLKDRLALATVAAGLRSVGVLEADGLQLERIREQIITHGLPTLVVKSVWSRIKWSEDHPLLPYFRLLDESRKPLDSHRVLWFCANAGDRKRLKAEPRTKQQAGLLLGYPECCVQFEIEVDLKGNTEFVEALIAKVGNDERSVARALRDDVGVEVSDEVFTLKNVPRTDAQFPFVIHIACDSCLSSETSPTGQLNASYEKLALALDPTLHKAIMQIRALCSRLDRTCDAEKKRVFGEMRQIQRAVVRA